MDVNKKIAGSGFEFVAPAGGSVWVWPAGKRGPAPPDQKPAHGRRRLHLVLLVADSFAWPGDATSTLAAPPGTEISKHSVICSTRSSINSITACRTAVYDEHRAFPPRLTLAA